MLSACKRLQNPFINSHNFKEVFAKPMRFKGVLGASTPIYADTRDDFQHLHNNVYEKVNILKSNELEGFRKPRTAQFRARWKQGQRITKHLDEKRAKSRNKDAKRPIEEWDVRRIARAVLNEVVYDEELNVPYDQGYDHLIEQEKAKGQENKQNDGFLDELKDLVVKLDYMREKDLINCHKYIIANKRKASYQIQAKYIILDTVIMEVLESKKKYWKKNLTIDKILDKSKVLKDQDSTKSVSEYVLSEFNDHKFDSLKEDLLQGMNEDQIDKVAALLATRDIDEEVNYEDELRLKKLDYLDSRNKHALALEKTDPFFSSFSSNEDKSDDNNLGDYYRFSFKDQVSDPKDFKDSLILKKIKTRYYRKKFALFGYDKFHNARTLDILAEEKKKGNKKELDGLLEGIEKTSEDKPNPWNKIPFFDENELMGGLTELERRNEIETRPPQFSDILEDVDMVYESLPVEQRIIFDREGSFYRQRFGLQDINIRELLWKNFTTDLNRMVPFGSKVMKDLDKNNEGFMRPKQRQESNQATILELSDEKRLMSKKSFEELDDLKLLQIPDTKSVIQATVQEDTDFMHKEVHPLLSQGQDDLSTEQRIFKEARDAALYQSNVEDDNDDKDVQDMSDGDDSEMTFEESRKVKHHFKKVLYPNHDTPLERKIIASTAPMQNEQAISLTEEQKIEIELYKQTRVDPFYEHYLKDSLDFYTSKTGELTRYIGKDLPFFISESDMISGDKIRPEKLEQYKYVIKNKLAKSDTGDLIAVARTKRARCWVVVDSNNGQGKIEVNNRKFIEYFAHPYSRSRIMEPQVYTQNALRFNCKFFVHGGGHRGQLEACRLAIAKALVKWDNKLEPELRKMKLLWQNRKRKERKKPGLYKARKKFIYKRR